MKTLLILIAVVSWNGKEIHTPTTAFKSSFSCKVAANALYATGTVARAYCKTYNQAFKDER